MIVNVEKIATLERKMSVELPFDDVEQKIADKLISVGRTAKIKGFRPGKIPEKVLKQHYGLQVRQEVLSDLIQQSYVKAIKENNLNPAGSPTIEKTSDKEGENFSYTAIFEVFPDITLKGLDKIKIERPEVTISHSDHEDMLENLRHQKATWSEINSKCQEGHRITVDFSGRIKDEVIKNGEGTDVAIVLGQGQMLPDFEKSLIGMKSGEEKSFKVKFPKDYHSEDLSGKNVDFHVKAHKVEQEILHPLDDSLAESYGIKKGGLKKLQEDITSNMERESTHKVNQDVKNQVVDFLLKKNPIEVPKALVNKETHNMQHQAMKQLGITDHEKAPPVENFKETAEKRVRLGLLLGQYVEENSLKADPERVRRRVEEMSIGYENPKEIVETYLTNPQFLSQIEPIVLEDQAIELLVSNGKEKKKTVSFKEYMNKENK